MKLPRSDLCEPDIGLPVSIGEKRHEVAIPRYRRGLFHSFKICNCLKFCLRDGTLPEVLRALQPNADANCENHNRPNDNEQTQPSNSRRRLSPRW